MSDAEIELARRATDGRGLRDLKFRALLRRHGRIEKCVCSVSIVAYLNIHYGLYKNDGCTCGGLGIRERDI